MDPLGAARLPPEGERAPWERPGGAHLCTAYSALIAVRYSAVIARWRLSVDAARLLGARRIVAIGLDTPFIDPVPAGMLEGKAKPAEGTPPGLPFAIHHLMLTEFGIHQLENMNLAEMARDKVWTSCAMVLPGREKGGAGAAVRPVAIGVPGQR